MAKKVIIVQDVKESFEECKKGDYVEYNGKVYEWVGWSWGTYPNIKDIETGEVTEIYPYC